MDTNDRGMLDVERFDLEPGRSILNRLRAGLHNLGLNKAVIAASDNC